MEKQTQEGLPLVTSAEIKDHELGLAWSINSSASASTVGLVHCDFDCKDTVTQNWLQHQWSITAATQQRLKGPCP